MIKKHLMRSAPVLALLGGTVIAALTSCGRDEHLVGEGRSCLSAAATSPGAKNKLDLLFVIDSSASMTQERESLSRNLPAMISKLNALPGGLPDLHLAVITSDLGAGPTAPSPECRPGGDRGVFLAPLNCGLQGGARFLVSDDAGVRTNFQGSLEQAFTCLIPVDKSGCGYEHPLQAARVALSGSNPENAGFLRSDAHLGLIFITDEDDCSAPPDTHLFGQVIPGQFASFRCSISGHQCSGTAVTASQFSVPLSECEAASTGPLLPVQGLVDFFRGLKGSTGGVSVSVIGGWPLPGESGQYATALIQENIGLSPICSSANGTADVSLRLKRFVDGFGADGRITSICRDDLQPSMVETGGHIVESIARCGTP